VVVVYTPGGWSLLAYESAGVEALFKSGRPPRRGARGLIGQWASHARWDALPTLDTGNLVRTNSGFWFGLIVG
jgi:hypothetical protein